MSIVIDWNELRAQHPELNIMVVEQGYAAQDRRGYLFTVRLKHFLSGPADQVEFTVERNGVIWRLEDNETGFFEEQLGLVVGWRLRAAEAGLRLSRGGA